MRPLTHMSLLFAVLMAGQTAMAQERSGSQDKGWRVSLGAGSIISPIYKGDDEYAVSVVPSLRLNYNDRFFASVENGIGYTLINQDTFRAGPLARVEFGRDEDGTGPFQVSSNSTTDTFGLGDIDTTLSLGGFVEYDIGPMTASIKAGKALGGHNGITGEVGLRFKNTLRGFGPPVILSAGPNIEFGDTDYMSTYFGVTAAQSAASGMPVYAASGGVVSYGVSATVIMPLTQHISVTTLASYDRLAGDAADAPLVQFRGSENQFFLGAVLGYAF